MGDTSQRLENTYTHTHTEKTVSHPFLLWAVFLVAAGSSLAHVLTQHPHWGPTFCHVVLSPPFKLEVVAISCCGLSLSCLSIPL